MRDVVEGHIESLDKRSQVIVVTDNGLDCARQFTAGIEQKQFAETVWLASRTDYDGPVACLRNTNVGSGWQDCPEVDQKVGYGNWLISGHDFGPKEKVSGGCVDKLVVGLNVKATAFEHPGDPMD